MRTVSLFDGVHQRPLGITLPQGCSKPAAGWPFVLWLGFGTLQGVGTLDNSTVGVIKSQLLSQGIAFVETTQYADDTYDCRECNSFELSNATRSQAGQCRSCLNSTAVLVEGETKCEPLRHWFICANQEWSWDRHMLLDLWQRIRPGSRASGSIWELDSANMAYIGVSVAAHMTSRAIQYGTQLAEFPVPRAAVMISGASYHCYSCPAARQPGEPADDFERCNWYSQGSAANSGLNPSPVCATAFPPFDKLPQNTNGVCPGHTLYPNSSAWWAMSPAAQAAADVLLTEEAWDNCSRTFQEHPPVLLVQPWEDSYAYWNAGRNYFEVLARQQGGKGCHMYAGEKMHGAASDANQATFNFLWSHLKAGGGDAVEVVV